MVAGEEYPREIETMQRECDELRNRLEPQSRKMTTAHLEDGAVDVGAIQADVEVMIKKAIAFQQEIDRVRDFENRS